MNPGEVFKTFEASVGKTLYFVLVDSDLIFFKIILRTILEIISQFYCNRTRKCIPGEKNVLFFAF